MAIRLTPNVDIFCHLEEPFRGAFYSFPIGDPEGRIGPISKSIGVSTMAGMAAQNDGSDLVAT